jgi:hypothetical protein
VAGAIKDWGHEVAKEYAYGAELGSTSEGFWPPQNRIEPLAALVLDMNLALARQALPAVVRLSTPNRSITPQFEAGIHAAGGLLSFHYRLSDAVGVWHLRVRDLQGKRYGKYRLKPSGSSVALPQSDFPRSLYVLEVEACGDKGCRAVYREKRMLGG